MPDTRANKVKVVRRKKKGPHEDNRLLKKKKRERIARNKEREQQALLLRQGGATYDEIARTLGLHDRSHAKKCVDNAIARYEIEAAKDVVRIDLLRLDEYIMRCTHDLRQNGNLGQIDRLMRIMEFRYRLLGINGEDIRSLQAEHGIHQTVNIKGGVQIVQASPETEDEFIQKMMSAVGVDPNSPAAQKYLEEREARVRTELPMLKGSANDRVDVDPDKEIIEGEILDALDEGDGDE